MVWKVPFRTVVAKYDIWGVRNSKIQISSPPKYAFKAGLSLHAATLLSRSSLLYIVTAIKLKLVTAWKLQVICLYFFHLLQSFFKVSVVNRRCVYTFKKRMSLIMLVGGSCIVKLRSKRWFLSALWSKNLNFFFRLYTKEVMFLAMKIGRFFYVMATLAFLLFSLYFQ